MSDAATQAYVSASRRTVERVGGHVRALVRSLPDVSDDAAQRYAASHARLVAAGQLVEARLAVAFLLRRWGQPPQPLPADVALVLAPVLVTPDTPSATSPVLRVRSLLSEGAEWAAAIEAAAGYAANLSGADLQAATRTGLDATASTYGHRVRWRKEPSGDACDWCQQIATETFGSADAVPFHAGDLCGVVPDEGEA